MKTIRAILNGKKAGNPELRDAIMKMRDRGVDVQVRVTWESQDMPRLVKEAVTDEILSVLLLRVAMALSMRLLRHLSTLIMKVALNLPLFRLVRPMILRPRIIFQIRLLMH